MMLLQFPKVKVIHLLSLPNQSREIKSVKDVTQLCFKSNLDYYQNINEPFDSKNNVENIIYNNNHWYKEKKSPNEWGLTSRHYGCFIAHRKNLLNFFLQKKYKFLLMTECDCKLLCDIKYCQEIIISAINYIEKNNLKLFTFGRYENFFESNHEFFGTCSSIFGTQMYLVKKIDGLFFQKAFEKYGWHTIDLWYNEVFKNEKILFGCCKKAISSQFEKINSIIDIK